MVQGIQVCLEYFYSSLWKAVNQSTQDYEQLNRYREVLLKESALCRLKHLAVFRVDIVLLLKSFQAYLIKNRPFYWKMGIFLSCVFCLSQIIICTLQMLTRSRRCLKSSRLLLTWVLKFTSILQYFTKESGSWTAAIAQQHAILFSMLENGFWRISDFIVWNQV